MQAIYMPADVGSLPMSIVNFTAADVEHQTFIDGFHNSIALGAEIIMLVDEDGQQKQPSLNELASDALRATLPAPTVDIVGDAVLIGVLANGDLNHVPAATIVRVSDLVRRRYG